MFKSNKLYFIHISKTAGSSLRQAFVDSLDSKRVLFASVGDRLKLLESTDLEHIKIVGGHIPYWVFEQSNNVKSFNWDKFCVVRSPIERLISLYNYLSISSHPDHHCFRDLSLKEFCSLYTKNKRPDLAMCYYFNRSCLFQDAKDVILRENIAVYTLDEIAILKRNLALKFGIPLNFKYLNQSKKRVSLKDLEDIELDFLGEDNQLYEATLNGEFPKLSSSKVEVLLSGPLLAFNQAKNKAKSFLNRVLKYQN